MNAEEKTRYFQELTLNLQREGFAVKPETEEGLLPVELDGQRLCLARDSGAVRYRREDAADEHRSAALDSVISIAKTTTEYMSQMEAAPQLTASGLTGDYRLLADFNGVVLAGHPTQFGVQFITWARVRECTGLNAGNCYGPPGGVDSYTASRYSRRHQHCHEPAGGADGTDRGCHAHGTDPLPRFYEYLGYRPEAE